MLILVVVGSNVLFIVATLTFTHPFTASVVGAPQTVFRLSGLSPAYHAE